MTYEELLIEAEKEGFDILENENIGRFKGLCINNTISLSYKIDSEKEKKCIVAEEIGHHKTTYGNIIDQSNIKNRKEENKGRVWAYKKLIPLEKIIEASENNIKGRYQLSVFLEVTEQFLFDAVKYYKQKYGICTDYKSYIIYFEPLGVLKKYSQEER